MEAIEYPDQGNFIESMHALKQSLRQGGVYMNIEKKSITAELKDEPKEVRFKSEEKYLRLISALNEKERALKKNIKKLEKKTRLVFKRFEKKIKAKQREITQLEKRRHELEIALREP